MRTLKNKIYKYMTSISENVCIDKFDDIVNKYNSTYHSKIKMKPVNVKSNTYINSTKKLMTKILNLELVVLLEYQNIKIFFAIEYVPNWSEKVFVINKVKNTVPWTYVISDLKGK